MNPAPRLSAQLTWAAHGLTAVQSGQSSTEWLSQCPTALRPGVQALLLTGLRQWGLSRALRQVLVPKPPAPAVDALLCLSLGLLTQDPPPYAEHTLVSQAVEAAKSEPRMRALAPLINACLRRCLREKRALLSQVQDLPEARWNHPRWWVEQLQKDHPKAWQQILIQAHQKPPMVLRINPRRTTKAQWLQRCRDAGIEVQDLPGQAACLPQPLPVQQVPGFAEGQCSVQDLAAQMAAPLLLNAMGSAPTGQRWKLLDACAAPGGKTAHLLECADVDVLALDVDAKRLLRVQDNLERLGLKARTLAGDAAAPESWAQASDMFDGILLDAPCSASGIVRRHPDIAWLRRPQDLPNLARQQKALLEKLWSRLKPGGFLLYCTCSVFKMEGENQVQAFVAHNTQAIIHPAPGHLVPCAGENAPAVGDNQACEPDGFFYALLQKAA